MSQSRRILLCGKSLLISGLQANLEAVPGLDLQLVDPQPECIREKIAAWKPDVLILETGLLISPYSLLLLHDDPQLKIIGLDMEDNRLLEFSWSACPEPTTQELLRVIEGERSTGERGIERICDKRGKRDESALEDERMEGVKKKPTRESL